MRRETDCTDLEREQVSLPLEFTHGWKAEQYACNPKGGDLYLTELKSRETAMEGSSGIDVQIIHDS